MRKLTGGLVVICGCFLPLLCRGAETNQARLFCLSVRFGQGQGTDGFSKMDFSSVDPGTLINGELFPVPGNYSHETFFLFDDGTGFGFEGTLSLNTPAGVDANTNGFNDFFESSQDSFGT